MDERFDFTPTARETQAALAAVARSAASQTSRPGRQLLHCLAFYGIPLGAAAIFFPQSFEAIYVIFVLLVVIALVYPRLAGGTPSPIAQRFAVAQTVRLTNSDIEQDSEHAHTRWPQSALRRLHVLDQVLVLEFSDWAWVVLPDRLWPSKQARQQLVDRLRAVAPDLLPDLSRPSVRSLFSLINVGAGFGAVDVFLLECGLLLIAASSSRYFACPIALEPRMIPVAFAVLFAAVATVAVVAFYFIRRTLRALGGRHPRSASIAASLLILPVPLLLSSLVFWRL